MSRICRLAQVEDEARGHDGRQPARSAAGGARVKMSGNGERRTIYAGSWRGDVHGYPSVYWLDELWCAGRQLGNPHAPMTLKTYYEEPDDDEPDKVRDQEYAALTVSLIRKPTSIASKGHHRTRSKVRLVICKTLSIKM